MLADDPLLLPQPRTRRPFARVVLDTRLRLPLASRLVRSASARTPVLVLTAATLRRAAPRARSPRRARDHAGGDSGRLDPRRVLAALRREGLASVMVEGGAGCSDPSRRAWSTRWRSSARRSCSRPARSLSAFGGPDPKALGRALLLEPVPEQPAFPWPWPPLFERWRPKR